MKNDPRCLDNATDLTPVSNDELMLVTGGGIWSAIGDALGWFAEQVAIQTAAVAVTSRIGR